MTDAQTQIVKQHIKKIMELSNKQATGDMVPGQANAQMYAHAMMALEVLERKRQHELEDGVIG